jgi:peptidoglycan/xylan/chitin deacetylase (PgdA/CDA1 family)
MKRSVSAKSVLAKLFGSFGIPEKTIRNRSGKGYVILMYHRILPSEQANHRVQPGMYVDPETFDMHIRYLKQHFQVVSFSDKFSAFQTAMKSRSTRPACILTFDDGWRDFYEFGYPVLKKNQVPATVFLPTGYIGTNDWFWTDRLAGLLTDAIPPANPEKPGNPLLERIAGIQGAYEERLEAAIHLLKKRNDQEIEEVIAALKERVGIGVPPNQRVFLSWEEVREMGGSGLVSFGSHTHNHRILVHLKEEAVREELALSKKILLREGVVDPSFIPFCYPNGNSSRRIACMVREAGYHAAVSTGEGWNDGDASPFELKRVAIHQDMTASREMFGCRIVDIL